VILWSNSAIMANWIIDFRYAFRALTRQPTFTLIAVLTLTLGIGANTAIFSMIKTVLLNPLPYQDPEQVVVLWEVNLEGNLEQVSIPTYIDWRDETPSVEALAAYRSSFKPSEWLAQPYSMIGVSVVCAETDAQADYLAGPSALSFTRLRQGRPMQMVTPEEVANYDWTPMERDLRRHWEGPMVKGDAASVRAQLDELVDRYQVDELMLITMVYDDADRRRSYELVAHAWNLSAPVAAT